MEQQKPNATQLKRFFSEYCLLCSEREVAPYSYTWFVENFDTDIETTFGILHGVPEEEETEE